MTQEEIKKLADAYLNKCGFDDGIRNRLADIGYWMAPASKGHHLAEPGGLVRHSCHVTKRLVELTGLFDIRWPRKESPFVVGMLHDLVKTKCYRDTGGANLGGGVKYDYVQPAYPGHGAASVMIAHELGIRLERAEIASITCHMGMFGIDKEYSYAEFNAALRDFAPFVIATHAADWWAARVDEDYDCDAPDGSNGKRRR